MQAATPRLEQRARLPASQQPPQQQQQQQPAAAMPSSDGQAAAGCSLDDRLSTYPGAAGSPRSPLPAAGAVAEAAGEEVAAARPPRPLVRQESTGMSAMSVDEARELGYDLRQMRVKARISARAAKAAAYALVEMREAGHVTRSNLPGAVPHRCIVCGMSLQIQLLGGAGGRLHRGHQGGRLHVRSGATMAFFRACDKAREGTAAMTHIGPSQALAAGFVELKLAGFDLSEARTALGLGKRGRSWP